MPYVYILASEAEVGRFYVGRTTDLRQRLEDHNSGKSVHTAKYVPCRLQTYFTFSDKNKAAAFERYLKSGSGRAFAKKHF
jgi:predicted GIY-YIG superfamily endonuclease